MGDNEAGRAYRTGLEQGTTKAQVAELRRDVDNLTREVHTGFETVRDELTALKIQLASDTKRVIANGGNGKGTLKLKKAHLWLGLIALAFSPAMFEAVRRLLGILLKVVSTGQ